MLHGRRSRLLRCTEATAHVVHLGTPETMTITGCMTFVCDACMAENNQMVRFGDSPTFSSRLHSVKSETSSAIWLLGKPRTMSLNHHPMLPGMQLHISFRLSVFATGKNLVACRPPESCCLGCGRLELRRQLGAALCVCQQARVASDVQEVMSWAAACSQKRSTAK